MHDETMQHTTADGSSHIGTPTINTNPAVILYKHSAAIVVQIIKFILQRPPHLRGNKRNWYW